MYHANMQTGSCLFRCIYVPVMTIWNLSNHMLYVLILLYIPSDRLCYWFVTSTTYVTTLILIGSCHYKRRLMSSGVKAFLHSTKVIILNLNMLCRKHFFTSYKFANTVLKHWRIYKAFILRTTFFVFNKTNELLMCCSEL